MRISVIIPTLNEATALPSALAGVDGEEVDEVIVVDGGSTDQTLALARAREGVRVMESDKGRARQMNAGAKEATGDVLLFLHADCRLSANAMDGVRNELSNSKVVGGCFKQRYDSPRILFRWLELCIAFRAGVFGVLYGDQGIFVRRDVFEAIGGFPDVPLMEDIRISRSLRKAGKLRVVDRQILVSARRAEKTGVVRTWLMWMLFSTLHACGISPERLARMYADVR